MNRFFYAHVMIARFVSRSIPCSICGDVPSTWNVVAWNPSEDGGEVRALEVCQSFCAHHAADAERLGERLRARPNGVLERVGSPAGETPS